MWAIYPVKRKQGSARLPSHRLDYNSIKFARQRHYIVAVTALEVNFNVRPMRCRNSRFTYLRYVTRSVLPYLYG